jgi:uncharacterized RDD family membrane protein YckC
MATFPADPAPLAGHGRRLAAALLDGIAYCVIVGAGGFAGFMVGLVGGTTSETDGDGWEELGWIVLGSVVGFAIGFVCWLVFVVWLAQRAGAHNGQTIGKQLVGIRVARVDGAPVEIGVAVLREIVAKALLVGITSSVISGFLGFVDVGLVGLVVAIAVWYGPALADDQRRALHDRMLRTRVVDAKAAVVAAAPRADELWPATR